ncbi:hypothetical protein QR680_015722 [Steinernema hermaphroditum]|uniref:DNA-directed RNA polymerase subunit n=1 Tax=Steinernema hermaphroditum TaxID=289476 RepID=A0AA39H8S6_9BILA|nr:hypothetical protein QR680_015722 [Steinernema hermaphroditum]
MTIVFGILAGFFAASASASAKLLFDDWNSMPIQAFFLIAFIFSNVMMWWNHTKALQDSASTLTVTVLNTGSNFLVTAAYALFVFNEQRSLLWYFANMGKGKEQFREADKSRRVAGVQFCTGDREMLRQMAHLEVFNNKLYEEAPGRFLPATFGPLDTRLGTSLKTTNCDTCNQNLTDCVGHFGFIDLEMPVFHSGFFPMLTRMLQCICKNCSALLLSPEDKRKYSRIIMNRGIRTMKSIHADIVKACKKHSRCDNCGMKNGIVKKAVGAVLKIAHGEPIPNEQMSGDYALALQKNKDLLSLVPSVKFSLIDPLRALKLFNNVDNEDIPILMCNAGETNHPRDFILTRISVPPVCIRPSVVSQLKAGSTEDDLTMKLTEIMLINDVLKKHKRDGAPIKTINETWDHLQVQCALYINSELSGIPPELQPKKFTRGLTQRLKGKQGRFRGNLSGKRVDFSGRTVISPDPNLKIDQVGVPIHVAKILTFPEVINNANIEYMRKVVRNGEYKHPGATHIIDHKTGNKKSLRYGDLEMHAKSLKPGDVVERHLNDNDVVLFNRQPSLHKISIMSHRVKVVPGRTFRFNECACTPYNADFDGDEMNLHVPQTYEARAEASCLMNVKSNLITPRSGEPLIAAIQDFITGGYLLTHKDSFFPRSEVQRFAAAIIDNTEKKQRRIRIPPPAILKPCELWTGKQLVELIIRPFAPKKGEKDVLLNLSTKNKSYTGNNEFCVKDSYVIIKNSQLIAGVLDKSLLGSGSKTNIFYVLMRDFGENAAVDAMWRLARMAPVFLSNRGFSIGIGDVRPGEQLLKEKTELLDKGYAKCREFIQSLDEGRLKAQPGCTENETLEALILRELSMIRDHAGQVCLRNLSKHNAPLTMAICGSKGSFINISQMIACVGQQAISGHRPPDGFEQRSLPHFLKGEKTPEAKGFVENSFYSGLTPTEFFFHTMGGREGLVDTAVKTAETGYMQRRLVKCLEDLCCNYDGTVRTCNGEVVEFIFGEDGLDPSMMEAKDGSVVDFKHELERIMNTEKYESDEIEEYDRKTVQDILQDSVKKMCPKNYSSFGDDLMAFLMKFYDSMEPYFNLPKNCHKHLDVKKEVVCEECAQKLQIRNNVIKANCLSLALMKELTIVCIHKLERAITEPGTAVGAVAATSIGEPSTQMTLKTFHFAGVASMNITQGVPRIKEIINAVKAISTPLITATLVRDNDEKLARRVKARIEKTTLGEVCEYMEEIYMPDRSFILIKLDAKRIRLLQLEVAMHTIIRSITSTKMPVKVAEGQIHVLGKTMLLIEPTVSDKSFLVMAMQYLKYHLSDVVIKGLPNITRCVINADERTGQSFNLLVEGTDFREVLATPEIDGKKTNFNNALIVAEVLGIEAARACIINEILSTMESHGIGLDRRHVMLLADLMTYRGAVLGITRNGLVRMKESVLLLASFEKTTDHLFEAAFFNQVDRINGVSECIIMGAPMTIGTGLFKLLHNHNPEKKPLGVRRKTIFESPEFRLKFMNTVGRAIGTTLAAFPVSYVVAVLFGAPAFSHFAETATFAAVISVFTALPLVFAADGDYNTLFSIAFENETAGLSKKKLTLHRFALGALFGAWVSCVVIPLDWDRWWQKWPVPCVFGTVFGSLAGVVFAFIEQLRFVRRWRQRTTSAHHKLI